MTFDPERLFRSAVDEPPPPEADDEDDGDDEGGHHFHLMLRRPWLIVHADGSIATTQEGTLLLGWAAAGTVALGWLAVRSVMRWGRP